MKLISAAIITICTLGVSSYDNPIASPEQVVNDTSTIWRNILEGKSNVCPDTPKNASVTYWLFSQSRSLIEIQNLKIIDFAKPIVIIIHGWAGDKNAKYNIPIRDAYSKRQDANIILIDYPDFVKGTYEKAYCNVLFVAKKFATFLCKLHEFTPIEQLHLVASSLGAHLAGVAGTLTQETCGPIGRITGLDPSGALYQNINPILRLDKSDALFVDIMHTNQGVYGYVGDMGHVDFYVNGGYIQPACVKQFPTYKMVMEHLLDYVNCNHEISTNYYAESINRNGFYSTSCCKFIEGPCNADLTTPDYTYMGESCTSPQKSQEYCLTTAAQSPFGLGPVAPLSSE